MKIFLSGIMFFTAAIAQTTPQDEITCSHFKSSRKLIDFNQQPTRNQLSYDVKYYDLDLTIDPTTETISGTVGVKLESLVDGLSEIEIDLHNNLTVSGINNLSGVNLDFTHSFQNILSISLSTPINTGELYNFVIHYSGPPGSTGFGSFGFSSHAGNDMIWSLSEPYGARNWWPCKDTPMDKADSVDISIEVPENLIVASNGLLVDEINSDGWTTYHWEERYPITTYLVSVAIYPYSIYHDWFVYGENDSMRLDYYVYDDLPSNYGMTKNMITEFSTRFGLYPFIEEKYGHADFVWGGGMEHQTISSMGGSSQYLISHELAHQWWGDMVTCANFHHIWLNEGFATYSQAMWWEVRPGGSMEDLHINMAGKAYYGAGTIYVSDTTNVGTIFNGNLSYNKASWVLHMLRHIVGDEAFFEGLQTYGDQYRFQSTVTNQFVEVMESVSGMELDAFFDRWIYGEYYPQYQSYPVWADLGNNTSLVQVTIHQDQFSPLFPMPVDVQILTDQGMNTFVANVTEQDQVFEFVVPGIPNEVNLDPNHWILRTVENNDLIPGMVLNYQTGWNLVGLPITGGCDNYLDVFPDAIEGTLYRFEDGQYVHETTLQPGVGYWIRNISEGTQLVQGDLFSSISLDLTSGWNLISGISVPVPITLIYDPDEILVSNSLYTFNGGYQQSEILEPGKAYWIKALSNGSISIILTP